MPRIDAPRLNAYIMPSFPIEELEPLKRALELGVTGASAPLFIQIVLQPVPKDYVGNTFEYMRAREDEAGRSGEPFLVVDSRAAGGRDGAVWYVDDFAHDFECDDDTEGMMALSTDVVWRVPVHSECLLLIWANYDVGNIHMQEHLLSIGVKFPIAPDYEVDAGAKVCTHIDMFEEQKKWSGRDTRVSVIAYPGEFEESTDEETRKKVAVSHFPMASGDRTDESVLEKYRIDKVARFKAGIAETLDLVNEWAPARSLGPAKKLGGIRREEFPEGCVTLYLKFDPETDWAKRMWPEESL